MSARDRADKDSERFNEWIRHANESGDEPAIPAATVVVLRDTDDGMQTLMLRKNSKIAFGGMWVFPGGKIDANDYDETGDLVAAARRAAVREAYEEAQLDVDAESLVMIAHWIPPSIAPKRFATWFFAAPVDTDHAVIDDGEIVEMEWTTPSACLARHQEGEIEIVPPTWITLHTLRNYTTVAEALEGLASRPPRHYATRVTKGEHGRVVMWQGDAAYDSGDAATEGGRHRLEIRESGYVYDDSGAL